MDRATIIAQLKRHEAELRSRGVRRIALFGSTARGQAGPDSDIDLMVDLDSSVPVGVFEYVSLVQYLEDLFPNHVDVANHDRMKPLVRPAAERDAIYAF
ncbi:MAG TPA: nucleotidyltransferase family protein [Stellaceae bacterium]|nr:nucleotidyltransferase family protein [Stellaceae bacterium]